MLRTINKRASLWAGCAVRSYLDLGFSLEQANERSMAVGVGELLHYHCVEKILPREGGLSRQVVSLLTTLLSVA